MGFDTQTIAWIVIAVCFAGVAWGIFWPIEGHADVHTISTHWELVHVDDDGILQFTMVRVLKINPTSRRMTAWCASRGCERVFKLSKIVKATDVRSGARVNIARLIDKPRVLTDKIEPMPDVPSEDNSDVGSWWSTSRLGLH